MMPAQVAASASSSQTPSSTFQVQPCCKLQGADAGSVEQSSTSAVHGVSHSHAASVQAVSLVWLSQPASPAQRPLTVHPAWSAQAVLVTSSLQLVAVPVHIALSPPAPPSPAALPAPALEAPASPAPLFAPPMSPAPPPEPPASLPPIPSSAPPEPSPEAPAAFGSP